MKPVKPDAASRASFLFRNKEENGRVTEEGMKPDEKLMGIMFKHKVRVQDFIEYIEQRNKFSLEVSLDTKIKEVLNELRTI